jgi:hypothetical protein
VPGRVVPGRVVPGRVVPGRALVAAGPGGRGVPLDPGARAGLGQVPA